ncbi:hypothetical protein [Prevotella sp. tc2-28]|uniref:hypothetical protein n=1 Tax=Prevotella sp. tc2-28 TaxID=1761888 RepID=UPI000B82F09A|nr:hypothetical protein [Prevotella sp. tc2-28]
MALEMNDLMMLRGMDKEGLSPYEQYKVGFMQQKNHTSGIGVAGLVLGTVGTAAAVGAWIFGPMYGNAKANQAKEVANSAKELANVQIAASQRQLDQLTSLLASERSERLQGDYTISQTITDTVSGQQASNLTAQQAAELSAVNSVMQQTYSDFVTGRASLNPTPVSLYSAPQPCACPASGCGCNG